MRPDRRNEPQGKHLRPERKDKTIRPCDQQEDESARIMRGEKTRGSGCGYDKGDAKNFFARNESKTTGKDSISIKMEYLCKISREAISDGKHPMFTFGFDNMPREFSSDWFCLPADVFDAVCGVLTAISVGNFEEATRWMKRISPLK